MFQRRPVLLLIFLLVVLSIVFFGRAAAAWWARHMALRELRLGAIGTAQQWADRAEQLKPGAYTTEMIRAACFRHLGQQELWQSSLELAMERGAPRHQVELELRLSDVQRIDTGDFATLLSQGASQPAAAMAVVVGLLSQGKSQDALQWIEGRTGNDPPQAYWSYLLGLCRLSLGQLETAQSEFEECLTIEPRHQMARTNLAAIAERRNQLDQALEHFVHMANHDPGTTTLVGLARVLRKLGRGDDARQILQPLLQLPDIPPDVALEFGLVESESGDYLEAVHWLQRADLDRILTADTLRAAATTFSLSGDVVRGERLFSAVEELQGKDRRMKALQARLAVDPHDESAADQLRQLATTQIESTSQADGVSELFRKHCAACHGLQGSGDGRAARHLFPRPRDLRNGWYRLIGTTNSLPAARDVEEVIRRGIPGASMPDFAHLPPAVRRALAEEVLRLRREGIREQVIKALQERGGSMEESEVRQAVEALTTPADALDVPEIEAPDDDALRRGKELYLASGCHHCHGVDGTGSSSPPLFDAERQPAVPRNLVWEPMKGGSEPESLYRRIRLGMPGTPHPASASLEPNQLIDLVQYCGSLAREPKVTLTNHQRAQRAATRAYQAALGGSAEAERSDE